MPFRNVIEKKVAGVVHIGANNRRLAEWYDIGLISRDEYIRMLADRDLQQEMDNGGDEEDGHNQ